MSLFLCGEKRTAILLPDLVRQAIIMTDPCFM